MGTSLENGLVARAMLTASSSGGVRGWSSATTYTVDYLIMHDGPVGLCIMIQFLTDHRFTNLVPRRLKSSRSPGPYILKYIAEIVTLSDGWYLLLRS
jgi:hypothetical protein